MTYATAYHWVTNASEPGAVSSCETLQNSSCWQSKNALQVGDATSHVTGLLCELALALSLGEHITLNTAPRIMHNQTDETRVQWGTAIR